MSVTDLDHYRRDGTTGLYTPGATVARSEVPNRPEQPDSVRADASASPATEAETGRTAAVRQLEQKVAERELLAELHEQRAATHVPSGKTLTLKQSSRDAEDRRAELANPARVALRDARAQLVTNVVGLIAAVIALGWSTANVQHTASLHQISGSVAWWLAWGVEPLISAALLTVMGASAYLVTRAVTVANRWVTAAQWVPLGYTVTLNCWTSLPAEWLSLPGFEFARGLVVHSVGPVVVVLLVHALPVLWAAFIELHGVSGSAVQNRTEQGEGEIDHVRARELLEIVRPAVEAGDLTTGVSKIGRYLRAQGHRAGVPMCQHIRDVLKQEQRGA